MASISCFDEEKKFRLLPHSKKDGGEEEVDGEGGGGWSSRFISVGQQTQTGQEVRKGVGLRGQRQETHFHFLSIYFLIYSTVCIS